MKFLTKISHILASACLLQKIVAGIAEEKDTAGEPSGPEAKAKKFLESKGAAAQNLLPESQSSAGTSPFNMEE